MKSEHSEITQEVGHTRASKTVHVSFPVDVLKKIQLEAKKCGLLQKNAKKGLTNLVRCGTIRTSRCQTNQPETRSGFPRCSRERQ